MDISSLDDPSRLHHDMSHNKQKTGLGFGKNYNRFARGCCGCYPEMERQGLLEQIPKHIDCELFHKNLEH